MPNGDSELFPLQLPAVREQIRVLFKELGSCLSMSRLATAAIERGVIPPEVLATCQLRGVQEFCRDAMKQKGDDGLPFAKPLGRSRQNRDWQQLDLFTYEQAEELIDNEAAAVCADYHELLRLHRWCLQKFGRAPEIPELLEVQSV